MRARTAVAAAAGAAAAYFYGTEQGRQRRAQLARRASRALHDPRIQRGLATVADQLDRNASRLPKAVTPAARAASSALRKSLDTPGSPAGPANPAF